MTHEEEIEKIFARVSGIFKLQEFTFKIMRRQLDEKGRAVIDLKKTHTLAHTNLKTKEITIDIYTTKHRKPKAMASILKILAHEIAHHQKMPYRQFYRGKWIVRQHYPAFYTQVNKNIEVMKGDEVLGKYFIEPDKKVINNTVNNIIKKKNSVVERKGWLQFFR